MKKFISLCFTLLLSASTASIAFGQTPPTSATLDPSGINDLSFANLNIAPGEVEFVEIIYDGIAELDLNTFFADANGNDTELGLYNELGNLLANNDDANGTLQSQLIFSDLNAGRYFLAVGLFNTSFGATGFNATSTSTASGDFFVDAITAFAPTVTGGTFDVLGGNFFEFEGVFIDPGQVEVFQLNYDGIAELELNTFFATNSDTEIGLYDELGNLIANNDDANGTLQSQLLLEDLAAGTYYVLVGLFNTTFNDNLSATSTSFSSGFVCLDVLTSTPNTSGVPYTPNGTGFLQFQEATIDPGEVEFYEVIYDGVAELTINTFFNDANGNDTELGFYDANGNLIDNNDDAGGTLQSELVFPDLPAGTYFLAVGLFNTSFGDFNFLATSTSTSTGNFCVDVITGSGGVTPPAVVGTIDIVGFDFFEFRNVAPGPFEVDFLEINYDGVSDVIMDTFFNGANGFDTEIGLYDSDGNLVDSNDDAGGSLQSRLVLKGLPAGTYFLGTGAFNTNFNPTDFDAVSNSTADANFCVDFSTFPATVVLGDVNGDGILTLLDIGPLVDAITSDTYTPEGDVNCDGGVDLLDVGPFVDLLIGG